jgi:hypothetical protein
MEIDPRFKDMHHQRCADTIADTLQELMCSETGDKDAAEAIAYAIETWYAYHETELNKWKNLKESLKSWRIV